MRENRHWNQWDQWFPYTQVVDTMRWREGLQRRQSSVAIFVISIQNTYGDAMSEPSKTRPKVPEGQSRFLKTRQMPPNEKGYVGYETIWDSFQKEVKYETPKKP